MSSGNIESVLRHELPVWLHCKPNRDLSKKHSLEIYCGMSAVQQQTNNFQCVYCHCTTATKLMLVLPMEELIWSAIGF